MTRVQRERLGGTALVLALMGTAALAAQGGAMRGQMMGGGTYDKSAEVTVNATVTEVKTLSPEEMRGRMPEGARGGGMMGGMPMQGPGVHLMATVDNGKVEIHLGPQSFLTEHKYTFAVGDRISVTGSRTKLGDVDTILARVIKKGDTTMTFRNEEGQPLWAGRGGGRMGAGRQ